jgi:hypothetical protein
MKNKKNIIILLLVFCSFIISGGNLFPAPVMEDEAIEKAAAEIYRNSSSFKGKKVSVYAFTNLEGKETAEGKRISNKILSKLITKKDLKFIERSEIDKILKEQEIQQSGAVDVESVHESGKVLPVDVMISGTVIENKGIGELHVKAVDVSSGEIYAFTSIDFKPGKEFSYVENQDKLKQFKKSPERYEKVNNSIAVINNIGVKAPVIYLLITIDDSDIKTMKTDHPKLLKLLNTRKQAIQKNEKRWKNLLRLRANLKLIQEDNPDEYSKMSDKKKELIAKGIEKKKQAK